MNRPERRSPIRRVGVRPQDRAGSETGAPIARFMAGEQVKRDKELPKNPIGLPRIGADSWAGVSLAKIRFGGRAGLFHTPHG
jgi:hypothetical protein